MTFVAHHAVAQTTSGDLTGIVTDPTGAVVPNATVQATNTATGVVTKQSVSSAGEYHFSNLPVGLYDLNASATGFSPATLKGVAVQLNKMATANISLQVGQTTSTVEVTEAAAVIDTSTATISNTFDSRQSEQLPSASTGSGVINLSLLQGNVATSGATGAGTGPSVGGARPYYNNFTVEGIDTNNRGTTGPVITVPNEAVGEFTVVANQFAPEFGHSSGGQFNTVIKSGTNTYHGSVYEYFQNRNLDAADNLDFVDNNPLHPRYDNNRFGGSFGGPIKHNKLFFFVDYEYNPVGAAGTGGAVFAPTSAGWNTLASISGINQNNLSILKQYLGTAATAAPPASTPNAAYPLIGAGNASLNQQTSSAVSIPIGQISTIAPAFSNTENAVAALDYTLSDKDNIRGRFILNRQGSIDTSGYPAQFYDTVPVNAYVVTVSEYHDFTPGLVNELRLGYNRFNQTYPVPNIKFPGLDQFPNIVVNELGVEIGADPNAPQYTIQNTYQLSDSISYTLGRHTLRFGFDGTNWISPQTFTQRSRGDYEWSYLSDYLFDYYPDYLAQRSVGGATYYGNNQLYGFYANDIWKLNSHLTLNLGVRYEYQTVPLGLKVQDKNIIANVPGLLDFSAPVSPKNNLMPRIGIAYSPGTSGKSVFRAGFGTAYDLIRDNIGLNTDVGIPEFATTVDVTGLAGSGFLAGGGISPNSLVASPTRADLLSETTSILPHNLVRPEVVTWNADYQRVIGSNLTLDARYVGTHGYHLAYQDQLNRQSVVTPSNALPVFYSNPGLSVLNGLTNTYSALNTAYQNGGNVLPAYAAVGVTGILTSYQPWGSSHYNGASLQANYRYTNGLEFIAAYTWSHDLDNSTADVFSTYTTPRRAQDFQNLTPDWSSSALDHRQRLTFAAVYTAPWFQHGSSNWIMKNLVGNWDIAPIFTYQTGTLATAQSGTDSNLNGDSAGDRAIFNPKGDPNIGSGTTTLTNSAGNIVGFLVTNPNAGYIATPKGAVATAGRNTLMARPIDDIDLSLTKRFSITEKMSVQFAVRAINLFNHPQYTGGYLNDVAAASATGAPAGLSVNNPTATNVRTGLTPGSATFAQWAQFFSSNPREVQISAKFTF